LLGVVGAILGEWIGSLIFGCGLGDFLDLGAWSLSIVGVCELRGLNMLDAGLKACCLQFGGDGLSDKADAGACGSGEMAGIATLAVQNKGAAGASRVMVVRVSPGASVVAVRFSGRSAAPTSSMAALTDAVAACAGVVWLRWRGLRG
jgi:hypothetical protein